MCIYIYTLYTSITIYININKVYIYIYIYIIYIYITYIYIYIYIRCARVTLFCASVYFAISKLPLSFLVYFDVPCPILSNAYF